MIVINRICDRNHAYAFDGPRKKGTVTGFSLMANRKYLINIKDLCDECITELIRPEGGFDDE